MFPMTSATAIQKPMGRGVEAADAAPGGDDGDDDETGEREQEGPAGTVIGGDGSRTNRRSRAPGRETRLASSVDPNAASLDCE